DPMLKCINSRNPWKHRHDAFQMHSPRACDFGRRIKDIKMFRCEELHGHRCHFTEFGRSAAVSEQILILRSHRVERMTGFVEDGLDIALHPNRIHENERHSCFGERALITTWCLSLAVGQVEQPQIPQLCELSCEIRVQPVKNRLASLLQLACILKWPKG